MNEQCHKNYRRILVIDDNESIHKDFDKILAVSNELCELDELDAELFGEENSDISESLARFEITHAMQGQEGLLILKTAMENGSVFGAAFVDMRMPPGWDGVETIQQLWQVDPQLQVIICTAFSDHSWEEITDRLGHTDKLQVLKKPFDEIEVVQLATSLCEKRRLLELNQQKLDILESTVDQQAAELESFHEDAETLIQSISSLIISLDDKGKVSRWNDLATQVFEIDEKTAVGAAFSKLDIEWSEPGRVNSLVSSKPINGNINEIVQFTDKSGQCKTLDIRVCKIINDPTSCSRLIVANDITHQQMLQSQLDQALRLESVGQLAAGVAHEINTPMQYVGDNVRYVAKSMDRIKQLLEVLPALVDESVSDEQLLKIRGVHAGTLKPNKIRSMLDQIPEALSDSISGVDTVSRIVAAMKEFSHPGSDEMQHVQINHILDSAVTVAKNEWKYVSEVETDLDESLPEVPAYGSELNQAFLNIIVNAAHSIADRVDEGKFAKGKITITTGFDEKFVHVSIQDNGGGIPRKIRNRLFEPFFTTKDVGKGTGQGLAIAHSVIVNKHFGKIDFEVMEEHGTTFNVRIPLKAAAPDDPPVSTPWETVS